jgi:ABC-type polysaccharide/polyol phosphate transport system ATPase subunit
MATAIETRGLSKVYRLGTLDAHTTLGEALSGVLRRPTPSRREVWALRGVSLAIEQGETFGLIGRNGAGKTTLLRVLSRITEPTEGTATVTGRVRTLLHVGLGFHGELTGRENVFLGGAILGMRRHEIRHRFDEIVEFAGIERFLDTPLKRYSSGMYLRLAFSVAAHLDPEILLVDEVLAVGDAEFQARCMGKMSELGREGRTVVFVSHDSGAVAELCDRAVLLEQGRVVREGAANEVVGAYMGALLATADRELPIPEHHGPVILRAAALVESGDQNGASPRRGTPVKVRLRFSAPPPPGVDLAVYVIDAEGRRIIDDALSDHRSPALAKSTESMIVTLPPVLRAGDYVLGVWIGTPNEEYLDAEVLAFTVHPRSEDRAESLRRPRLVQPPVEWGAG